MSQETISEKTVLHVIAMLGPEFHTLNVSKHSEMQASLPSLIAHRNYNAMIGAFLSRLAKSDDPPLRLLRKDTRGAWWQNLICSGIAAASGLPVVEDDKLPRQATRLHGQAVRDSHYRVVEFMKTPEFLHIKSLFEARHECGGVYFQPTDRGVIPKDLHKESAKPLIGIGDGPGLPICPGVAVTELERTLLYRIASLEDKRRGASSSREKQLEARLIREAQANRLIIPEFPDRLRFIHSQWRIDKPDGHGQQLTDLAAVDLSTQSLVIIELKPQPDPSAITQVAGYVRYFQEHAADLEPFFLKIAQMMGTLYDCPELVQLAVLRVASKGVAAWLENGRIVVHGL